MLAIVQEMWGSPHITTAVWLYPKSERLLPFGCCAARLHRRVVAPVTR
jgi:hypothetical protein